jgi:1-acyl-sn-glycerol-3-phosphate acyltransferase
MNEGQDLLAKGTSVVIFPQSTRSVEFVPKEFNTLGVKLARASNAQVIPFALKTDFWENGKVIRDLGPIIRSRPIYMSFGKPFFIEGNGKSENRDIVEFISAHLARWNSSSF